MNKPEYFVERSLCSSYEDAVHFSNIYNENRNLKLKDIVGEEVYSKWKHRTSSLTRENIVKNFKNEEEYLIWKKQICGSSLKNKRPSNINYWVNLGFDIETAKEKLINRQRTVSKRCVDYWLSKGFSIEESQEKVSEYQDNLSLKKLIKIHGEILGSLYHNEMIELKKMKSKRSINYWKSIGYDENSAKYHLRKYQSDISKNQKKCKEYWLNIGFNLEDSIILSKNYARIKCYFAKEYWVDKGFSLEDSIKIQKKIQQEFGYRGIRRCVELNIIPFRFKIEIDFCDFLITSGLNVSIGEVIENKFPDIIFENNIIEIFGDYWHGNPKFYSGNNIIKNKKVSDVWNKDNERIKIFESLGYNVIVIWEDDLKKNGFDYYRELILKN